MMGNSSSGKEMEILSNLLHATIIILAESLKKSKFKQKGDSVFCFCFIICLNEQTMGYQGDG